MEELKELEITAENFTEYFFDVRRHKPKAGQILAKFSAVAAFGPGQAKKDIIKLLLMDDKVHQAVQVMNRIHCAKFPDAYIVCREIAEDLLNGLTIREVENKEYEFVIEAFYYTNREYVPKNDPHWETIQVLDYDSDNKTFSSRIEI